MIRRVADRLAGTGAPVPPGADRADGGDPVVDELAVSCRADQREAVATALRGIDLPVRWAIDEDPDRGPIAGIETACRVATEEYAAVVACDMPFVDPRFVAALRETAAGRDAAVPRLDGRWFQTTQAVYATGPAAASCERALDRGDRRVLVLIDGLDAAVVGDDAIRSVTTARTFTNVNTREELAAATAAVNAAVDGGCDGDDVVDGGCDGDDAVDG